MTEKLRIYLETNFMFYLTGRQTSDVKVSADQAYARARARRPAECSGWGVGNRKTWYNLPQT